MRRTRKPSADLGGGCGGGGGEKIGWNPVVTRGVGRVESLCRVQLGALGTPLDSPPKDSWYSLYLGGT